MTGAQNSQEFSKCFKSHMWEQQIIFNSNKKEQKNEEEENFQFSTTPNRRCSAGATDAVASSWLGSSSRLSADASVTALR